jgi:opacity protein-like surface antigen
MKHIASTLLFATSLAVTSAHAVIVGASVGYLTDAKDEYVAARVGTQFSANQSIAHIGEFEIGYTSQSESGITADFMPVTLNYRAEFANAGKFGTYAGVGAGMAMTKVKAPYGISADNWSFAAQGFAGVSYKVSDKARLNLGARYVWIDDVRLLGSKVEVGDDVALEIGFGFKF